MLVAEALEGCQDPGLRLATEPSFLRRARPGGADALAAAWLAVALCHKSWLYENADEGGPNGPLLGAFAQLGNDVLALEVLAYLDSVEPDAGLVRRHAVLSQRIRLLERLAVLLDLDTAARLGAGEAAQSSTARAAGRTPPAFVAVAAQCLAWWSLFGDEGELRLLVADAASQALSEEDSSHADAKTLAEQAFRGQGLTYECAASGPDHQRTFRARAVLVDGRAGAGAGPSKKAATKAAALDLLRVHAPDALALDKPRQDPSTGAWRSRQAARRDAGRYRDLARAFRCESPDDFALALTHRSWTYEQDPRADLDAGSNTLLAHAGRQAFDVVLNRLRLTNLLVEKVAPDADEAILGSLPDEAMPGLLAAVEGTRLVRVGQGQRQLGLQVELAAGCVQALFGAALAQHRSVRHLEHSLPGDLLRALNDLVGLDPLDHATRLHRELAPLGLVISERSVTVSGPTHRTKYAAVLAVQGGAGTAELHGHGGGKRQARKAAAAVGVRGLALLDGDRSPVEASHRAMVALLLRAQVAALAGNDRRWARWVADGRLGSGHLAAGDGPAFRDWADQALDILGAWRPADGDLPVLARFFAFARSTEVRPVFARTLGDALDRVQDIAAADTLDRQRLEEAREAVRVLAATHAVQLADGPAVLVADVVQDFGLLARRAVDVVIVDTAPTLLPASAAAAASRLLHETAGLVQQPGARPRVTLALSDTSAGCEVAVTALEPSAAGLLSSRLAALVEEAVPELRLRAVDGGFVIALRQPEPDTWLHAAAMQSGSDSYGTELARLLHDLKNQLTAAAAAVNREAGTRTLRLENELAASRHLDQAGGLAGRLRAAQVGLGNEELAGVVEVDAFLREYSRQLLRALPASVHIATPRMPAGAAAAIAPAALAAVLDNLIKNAAEAMTGGGTVTLEAVAAGDDVLIDVSDDGPGVPDHVLRQLSEGRVPGSAKRDGSGLGVASAQRLLARVGGYLDWSTGTGPGHSWQVVVPAAQRAEA